ncbi:MAG: amidohydrolase [Alistipes sp.]|nr:amidohydrolase [Alistipes sp.]MBO7285921.1 amidohydrolase [Alistipes sp.]
MNSRITLVQRNIAWLNIDANLMDIETMLEGVKTDVVVLSEMFQTGFATNPIEAIDDGRTLRWMLQMAKKLDAAIVGSCAVKVGEEYRNRMYFVKPTGEVEYYDKWHLFSVGGESDSYTRGRERKIVEWRGVRYLLAVCYDLRFPVWSRQRGDYDAIIYIAAWPTPRREVWQTLLKARAIENQAYVIGVNRTGDEPTLSYSGDSAVIDYYGKCVVECGSEECVANVEIDIDNLNAFRDKFNVSADADEFKLI